MSNVMLLTDSSEKWSWPKDVERWLRSQVFGLSLNFPSGNSRLGSIRVDLDKNVKPDIIADLRYPPFRPFTFDFVICDPPFNMYNKFKWLQGIAALAKKTVIFSGPLVSIKMKGGGMDKNFPSYRNTRQTDGSALSYFH